MAELVMFETTVFLKLETKRGNCANLVDVKIHRGNVEYDDDDCVHRINFEKSRGGKTFLLKKVIKSNDPRDYNKIKIITSEQIIVSSYNEIISLPYEYNQDSTKIYILTL